MTGLIMLGAKGGGGGGGSAGGGSCKFYECASVDDGNGSPAIKAGITISGDITESVKGFYSPQGDTSDLATAVWGNGSYYLYKCNGYDYWIISPSLNDGDPGNAYYYAEYRSGEPPWDASNWQGNYGGGTVKITGSLIDVPEIPATGVKSWTGYEWVQTADEAGELLYQKSETLTEGLSWTSVKPKVGKSYTEDALVEAKLYEGYSVPTDFIYHWAMSSASEFSEASISGAVVFGTENDRPVAKFDGNSQINYTSLSDLPQGNATHSIALWVRSTTPCTSESPECLVGWGSTPYSATATALSWELEGTSAFTNWREFLLTSPVLTDGSWHHLVGTFDGTTAKLYVDGEQVSSAEVSFAIGGTQFGIGGCFWTNSNMFTGSLSDIYIFNRSLSATDIMGLYKKYA
jgi:hypothetical protein